MSLSGADARLPDDKSSNGVSPVCFHCSQTTVAIQYMVNIYKLVPILNNLLESYGDFELRSKEGVLWLKVAKHMTNSLSDYRWSFGSFQNVSK